MFFPCQPIRVLLYAIFRHRWVDAMVSAWHSIRMRPPIQWDLIFEFPVESDRSQLPMKINMFTYINVWIFLILSLFVWYYYGYILRSRMLCFSLWILVFWALRWYPTRSDATMLFFTTFANTELIIFLFLLKRKHWFVHNYVRKKKDGSGFVWFNLKVQGVLVDLLQGIMKMFAVGAKTITYNLKCISF